MKREYLSDPGALCGAERFVFAEGKGKGVEAVRLYNGKLDLTVLLDRRMDLFRLFYRGTPVSYISKNGLVSPRLSGSEAYGFLNSFGGGFLYTCGPDNIGAPCMKEGRMLPQHGSGSYLPAQDVRFDRREENGKEIAVLSGTMRFTALFGGVLTMRREIVLGCMGDDLTVRDTVRNDGFTDDGYLLMYHVNLGYPVLDEHATLFLDAGESAVISGHGDVAECLHFEPPSPARPEEVYRHTLNPGKGVKARLRNGDFALEFLFDPADFPHLLEWKSMACGDYVLGIEPVTTPMPERIPILLRPSEERTHQVTFHFSS